MSFSFVFILNSILFGIGLAIAAAIVEKHGGSISANMEGDQLVFTCKLPKGGDHA